MKFVGYVEVFEIDPKDGRWKTHSLCFSMQQAMTRLSFLQVMDFATTGIVDANHHTSRYDSTVDRKEVLVSIDEFKSYT